MTEILYPLRLPASIKSAAERLAKEDGVPLDTWIAVAIAQKIGAVETAAELLKDRAGHARPEDMLPVLERVPDVPPAPEDELPPSWKRRAHGPR